MRKRTKNEAAASLAKRRWAGVSKAERSRLGKAAINARWAKHRETEAAKLPKTGT